MDTSPKERVRLHFEKIAREESGVADRQASFRAFLTATIRNSINVDNDGTILELGCGTGDLLAELDPPTGIGIDFSEAMVQIARQRHEASNLDFQVADVESYQADAPPHTVVADFLLNYLGDIQATLEKIHSYLEPESGLLLISIQNTVWRPLVWMGRIVKLAHKGTPHSWISSYDVRNFLHLAGFEVIQERQEILWPFRTPIIDCLFNRYLARMPLLRHLCGALIFTARSNRTRGPSKPVRISIIIPARNESGHLLELLPRIPETPPNVDLEIVLVEGNSTDDTWKVIQEISASDHASRFRIQTLQQSGRGKWNAVQEGIAASTGDICVIQDADLTAPPEDLSKFFQVLTIGGYRFASGSRLVYPMESDAMKWINLLGNRFFAICVSFVIRRAVKDSLCGTKGFYRADFDRMKDRLPEVYAADPFGDFFLIFGASALQLRAAEIPVRYRARKYGETNISRWRDSLRLMRICWIGALKLRFASLGSRKGDRK